VAARFLRAVSPRILLRGIVLIASLATIGLLVRASGLDSLLTESWIDTEVRGHGLAGELLFVGVGALVTAVGFPRQVVAFLGGYAFGALLGTVLAVLATVGGCMAAFAYARLLGRDLVAHRYPQRIQRADLFLRDNPLLMAIVVRSMPVGNNLLTTLIAGVTSVRPLPFFVGSAIGYIPQNAAFALAGSGVHIDPVARITLAVVLLVASSALGIYLYRRYRRGRVLDDAMEEEGDDTAADPSGVSPSGVSPSGVSPSGVSPSGVSGPRVSQSGVPLSGIVDRQR
jgi:uncharacterized membrane protein YdjX (TVP38/TMEM64 family)